MNRIANGFNLIKISWRILTSARVLLLLPLLMLVAVAAAAGIGGGAYLLLSGLSDSSALLFLALAVALLAFYTSIQVLNIFFTAAIVAGAAARVDGGHPSLNGSLAVAWAHRRTLLKWALVTSTVGLVCRFQRRAGDTVSTVVFGGIAVAWDAVTLLVVPVILAEDLNVTASVTRANDLFRLRWGEELTGIGVAYVLRLLVIPVLAIAVVLAFVNVSLGIAVGAIGAVILTVVGATLGGAFNAVLYRFATTGQPIQEFA